MDPRIRRRRVEVQRQEGRRRLRVLVGITAVVAVGCGGWAATGSPLLDVDHVVVDGATRTPVADVVTATGIRAGRPMVDVDVRGAERAVDALPWVQHATVHRQWPGRVRVVVTERRPVAVTGAGDGASALVDASGRVLAEVEAPPGGLAALSGLPPPGPPGSVLAPEGIAALSVALALPAELRDRTAGVAPTSGSAGEVELHLAPDGTIRLGPPDHLQAKFNAIRAVMAQVDLRNLAVLDVRRPDSPVLTRRETPTKVSTPRAG
jgi:cell division protein FtsQ